MSLRRILSVLKWCVVVFCVAFAAILGARAWDAERGPPLQPWHLFAPTELTESELDHAAWPDYIAAENAAFDSVRTEVTDKLPEPDRTALDRYYAASPIYPPHFAQDWNRSTILEPAGAPIGAAVFLHGLTDAPYSLRHIAERYRAAGYIAILLRLPGHGTTPAALTQIAWPQWSAAVRLAMREAATRAPGKPIHLVGYSNGGALAMIHAMDALDNPALIRPDRVILLSPMIGVSRFARFSGLAGLPAFLPAFAKAAWLGILPEYNPFKYNSFPVNAARQSWLVTQALADRIRSHLRNGTIEGLPPILTFQSTMDATVLTRAVVTGLYDHLPANGSELVLFDVNRATGLAQLLRPAAEASPTALLPAPPRRYRATIIANETPATADAIERVEDAGATTEWYNRIGLAYPPQVYSLSHIAVPFPVTDPLYGLQPDPGREFGIALGAIDARGERGVLVTPLDAILRISSNPFFPYLLARVAALIDPAAAAEPPHLPWPPPGTPAELPAAAGPTAPDSNPAEPP
jgi:alpha-beta hydrolase superfamily lysophospholipase